MVTLANVRGADLAGQVGEILGQGFEAQNVRRRAVEEQEDLESKIATALGLGGPSSQVVDDAALGRLGQLSPQMAQAVGQARQNPQQSEALREEAQRGLTLADELQNLPDHAARLKRLAAEAGTRAAEGGSLDRLVSLSNLDEGALNLELQRMQLIGKDTLSLLPQAPTATSAFAALIADDPAIGTALLGRRDTQIAQERQRRAAAAAAAERARIAAATPKTELGRQIKAIESDIASEFIQSGIGEQQIASLRAAAVAGVPFEGVTDLGKIIQDENAIISIYGEDSPQADAFRELREGEAEGDPPSLSDIGGIRKEFTSNSGDFVTMRDAQAKIEAAASDPSAAGDLALVFNYMKVLDPGSVVRESEFATAQNAAGVPDRIRNIYNKVLSGEILAEGQREDFVDTAGRLFSAQEANQQLLIKEFTGIAERANINPKDVIVDFVGEPADISVTGEIQPVSAESIVAMQPADISQISREDFLNIPFAELSGLTPAQWDALEVLGGKFE